MRRPFKNLKTSHYLLLLFIFALPASIPLFHAGFFHFSDEPHIANLYEMIRAIQLGQFPPRWAPDMIWGYGYPLFNFYYPLPFYVGAFFFSFTGSLIQSLKLVFLLSILVSPIGMFLWLRKHTQDLNAFIGSVIYVYSPYRAVDLYVRGALGECVAFAVIPFVFLSLYKIVHQNKSRHIVLLAVSIAVLILSHNLAPLLFIPIASGYALVLAHQKKNYELLLPAAFGLLLGLALSAYFWLPAFIEKGLLVSVTPFNYSDHFPFIKQLVYSPFRYGASVWGPHDDISFQIGIVNISLVFLSLLFILKKNLRKEKILWTFMMIVLVGTLFFMNVRSSFLWELFSLATYVQFPWRLLMITTFITSSLVIFINNRRLLVVLGAASILLTANYFQPSEYFYPNDNYFLHRFFANRNMDGETTTVSSEYVNYSEDYLLLPKWVAKRPIKLPEERIVNSGIEILSVAKNSDISYEIKFGETTKEEPVFVDIYHYYFPGWFAEVNGHNIPISIIREDGHMRLENVAPNSTLKVFWSETPLRKMADGISIIGLAVAVALSFPRRRESN
jgi:hypothetical protein